MISAKQLRRLYHGAPPSRELNDPPLLWKRQSSEGYFTPAYGLGWRLGWYELCNYLDSPESTEDIADFRTHGLASRWIELGYAAKYDLEPRMIIFSGAPHFPDPEVIVQIFSNNSKQAIEASQRPDAAEIIKDFRHTLGLDFPSAPEPKWLSHFAGPQRRPPSSVE